MIRSEILTRSYPDGEVQRVQLVRWDDWSKLRFLRSEGEQGALATYAQLYRRYLIPACPWIFGQMLLFMLPQPGNREQLLSAADTLRRGVKLRGGKPVFATEKARTLWEELAHAGCFEIAAGRLPVTRVLPVDRSGFLLSRCEPEARLRVNASFFIFDPFDCATRYDAIGTPFGLMIEDGEILSPPLYGREALLVYRDGHVSVETPALEKLCVRIGEKSFCPGHDGTLFTRPFRRKTPPGTGWDHVIVGRKLIDVVRGGCCNIPASGFVLRLREKAGEAGDDVWYEGMERVLFAIQAGNSLVRGGRETTGFISTFYNVYRPWNTPYPPSLYPLDYEKARASRIALGADAEGKPMLLWAEGAAKIGHQPGDDSCGASLSEFAAICRDAGMVDGVNLDGGGSAQILVNNERSLQLSDRDDNGTEQEREIPLGLVVR